AAAAEGVCPARRHRSGQLVPFLPHCGTAYGTPPGQCDAVAASQSAIAALPESPLRCLVRVCTAPEQHGRSQRTPVAPRLNPCNSCPRHTGTQAITPATFKRRIGTGRNNPSLQDFPDNNIPEPAE